MFSILRQLFLGDNPIRGQAFLCIMIILFSADLLRAQDTDTEDPDILLTLATNEYRSGNFEKALTYTQNGLALAPQYHDIRLVETRVYLALDDPKNAAKDLYYLIENAPDYPGVRELAYQVINHAETSAQKLEIIRRSQQSYPEDLHLRALEASFLLENKQRKEAHTLANELLHNDALSGQDRYLLQAIYKRSSNSEAGINYQYNGFSDDYTNTNPWHTAALEYQRNIHQTAIIGRAMFSARGDLNGQLYEIEAYPVFSRAFYTLVSAGFSSGALFPDFRGSASAFYNFAPKWETEAGLRYASYGNDGYVTGIGGLTLYQDRFYFNAKTILGPKQTDQLAQSYQLNVRYYLSDADNYLFVKASSGISPDQRTIFTQLLEDPTLEAFLVGTGVNKMIGMNHILQISVHLLNERIGTANAQQFIGNIGYRYRF